MAPKTQRLISPAAVELEYSVAGQTLANWRHLGRGPNFIRVSARKILYDRADLERFFSERKVVPGKAG